MTTGKNTETYFSALAEDFNRIVNVSPKLYADLEREISRFEINNMSDIARIVKKATAILDIINDDYDSGKSNSELFGTKLLDIISNLSEEKTDYLKSR